MVRWLGGSLTAPHMIPERVEAFFGDQHRFLRIDKLKHTARVGVPVDVPPSGDLTKELEYENLRAPRNFTRKCGKKR